MVFIAALKIKKKLITKIRNYVDWSLALAKKLHQAPRFQEITKPILSLFTFCYLAPACKNLDEFNQKLVEMRNDYRRIYLIQTNVGGKRVILFQTAQFEPTQNDVD